MAAVGAVAIWLSQLSLFVVSIVQRDVHGCAMFGVMLGLMTVPAADEVLKVVARREGRRR